MVVVGRWEPGARGRLGEAAVALFAEQGYEQTTVAAIAERAGLTERTFFRHFPDKREVLFSAYEPIEDDLVAAVVAAPAELSGLDAVVAGVQQVAAHEFAEEGEAIRWRQSVIDSNAELRERELLKLAGIATSLAGALRTRGLSDSDARLLADAAISVFQVAVADWTAPGNERGLSELIDATLARYRALVAGA